MRVRSVRKGIGRSLRGQERRSLLMALRTRTSRMILPMLTAGGPLKGPALPNVLLREEVRMVLSPLLLERRPGLLGTRLDLLGTRGDLGISRDLRGIRWEVLGISPGLLARLDLLGISPGLLGSLDPLEIGMVLLDLGMDLLDLEMDLLDLGMDLLDLDLDLLEIGRDLHQITKGRIHLPRTTIKENQELVIMTMASSIVDLRMMASGKP